MRVAVIGTGHVGLVTAVGRRHRTRDVRREIVVTLERAEMGFGRQLAKAVVGRFLQQYVPAGARPHP